MEQAKALLANELPFFSDKLPFLTPGDTFETQRKKQLKDLVKPSSYTMIILRRACRAVFSVAPRYRSVQDLPHLV